VTWAKANVGSPRPAQAHSLFSAPWGDETKFGGVAWTPDRRHLFYVRPTSDHQDAEIWKIAAAGGAPERTGLRLKVIRMPRVHPDGERLAFGGAVSPLVNLWTKALDVTRH